MQQAFKAIDIDIGYHPRGYRIDKTASPLNRYTRWQVDESGTWSNPAPVCFDALPGDGWVKSEGFDWELGI